MQRGFIVLLPIPPSQNESYLNVSAKERAIAAAQGRKLRGRKISPAYGQWRDMAGWEVKIQKAQPVLGAYKCHFKIPYHEARDIDNYVKGTIDLLVHMSLVEGDKGKFHKGFTIEWWDQPLMQVEVYSA